MCAPEFPSGPLIGPAWPSQPDRPAAVVGELPAALSGSRRRRLWELGDHAHCPVIGVCLPIAQLRRLVGKVVGGAVVADDYTLHGGVIADCKQRSRTAEAVQRELDRRYAVALRQAARHKDREALARAWREALASEDLAPGMDLPGLFWAALTHARCDAALEEQLLRDIHMLQHQLGSAHRADLRRLHAALDENAVLARELGAAQQRATRLAREQGQKIDQLQAQALRLRGELLARDTVIAQLREALSHLEQTVPGLPARSALARQNEAHVARIQDLERALSRSQQALARAERRNAAAEAEAGALVPAVTSGTPAAAATAAPAAPPAVALQDRAVLCVGGRPASVPVYRQLVEGTGGRFLHHDGGAEDSAAKLDATLAAADLVICQTGCVSHDAYWRVKDHCKRTGKRCVFVETPSGAGLQRALRSLGERAERSASVEIVAIRSGKAVPQG